MDAEYLASELDGKVTGLELTEMPRDAAIVYGKYEGEEVMVLVTDSGKIGDGTRFGAYLYRGIEVPNGSVGMANEGANLDVVLSTIHWNRVQESD